MVFSPLEKIDPSPSSPRRPLALMSFFMLAVFGLALARLFELTVIHGAQNRDRADQNRILVRPLHAPRGVILDRKGIPLTKNVPVIREIDFPGDDLGPVPIEEAARSYPFGPALAHAVGYVGEVSQDELSDCSGPSSPSVPSNPSCPLESGDITGKSGLEKQYDFLLRGTDGADLIEIDANGKTLRTISTQPPISGQDLAVNLDADLAVAAYAALSGKKGSAVAVDPADGSILALVSSPSFDPSNIAASLADTENLPLFNRAASGQYPPGSIFKLVTASAGLSENKISASTLIEDTGEIRVGDFRYGNWYFDQYGRTEGAINITRAIARSNDIFFYRVGEWLGPQTLADWAKKLGLGQKTGVDLPSEADGLIPDPVWKQRQIGEKWYLGNTYHMAIGQGDVRVTPLQVAEMTASVATGQKCRPRIATESRTLGKLGELENQTIGMSDSRKLWLSDFLNFRYSGPPSFLSFLKLPKIFAATAVSVCQEVGLSKENRELILAGMVGACSSGGTAFPFFQWNEGRLPPSAPDGASGDALPMVGCKTGTAQHGGAKTLPHAWIAVAGPVTKKEQLAISNQQLTINNSSYQLDLDSPKRIILVVLVEESGEGSAVAAPLAKQILTDWFK